MNTNTNTNTNMNNENGADTCAGSCRAVPILYIEESIKRFYDVKKKVNDGTGNTRMRTSQKKYYDVDWRFYIIYRFGNYIVCGTRCPAYDYLNDKWPVISISFTSTYDAYTYIMLMTGRSKVNITLYVSRMGGCATDVSFAQPTGDRFRELDVERSNRRNEMVGYDRTSPYAKNYVDSNIVKLMSILASAENGSNIMPFTASRYGSLRQAEWYTNTTCQCYNGDSSGNCDMVNEGEQQTKPTSADAEPAADTNVEDGMNDNKTDENYNYGADYDQRDDYYDYVAWDYATTSGI